MRKVGVSGSPERIGRYELLLPLGVGGMGTVYLGLHEVMPGVMRYIAVKLMHPEVRANRNVAPQLLQEARLAARIEHPNVVRMIEAGEEPEGVFLAMSYVEGTTLAHIIAACSKVGRRLPVPIVLRIMKDALSGLHTAHELRDEEGTSLKLVHRDFSPQNILVGIDGITQLTDFGIAKATGQMDTTKNGVVKGKVGYMSPEQAMGKEIDRRSDVWAAGVVTWEAFAGRRLFRAANNAAVLLEVVSGKAVEPLGNIAEELSGPLEEAVSAALVRQVDQRLMTAAAFRKALESAGRSSFEIAEAEDVASFVKDIIGAEIEDRRRRAKVIAELRAEEGEDAPTEVRVSHAALEPTEDEISTAVKRPSYAFSDRGASRGTALGQFRASDVTDSIQREPNVDESEAKRAESEPSEQVNSRPPKPISKSHEPVPVENQANETEPVLVASPSEAVVKPAEEAVAPPASSSRYLWLLLVLVVAAAFALFGLR